MRSFALLSGVCVLAVSAALGQTSSAPVPPAIRAAKTIFISNAGADSFLFPVPFSGTPTRGYDEFYGSLKASEAYTLVDDPSKADLVLELSLTVQNPGKVRVASSALDPLPMFRLVIVDGRSHYILWTITQTIAWDVGQKRHDRDFDTAVGYLAGQFLKLGGHAVPSAP